VEVNYAGLPGFLADNLAAFIGAINFFQINFLDAVSPYPVLNISPNPASTRKARMALYGCFRVT
jgi:hypothetical protein